MRKTFKTLELFAGAGGLALGLEQAGFEHIGLIELDLTAVKTLRKNRPSWPIFCEDISQLSKLNLNDKFNLEKYELDLLSGGPPCQSFSYAGKKQGINDERGKMFLHYANFLEQLQPKMFLFENVKGLLSHNKGQTFTTIARIFSEKGYEIQYKILNAFDYGVAQKRERIIVIGIRKDLILKTNFNFPVPKSEKKVLRDVLKNVPKSLCDSYSNKKVELFKLVPPGGSWKDIDPNLACKYMKKTWDSGGGKRGILRRLSLDEPSLTVLTSAQMKQTERCHPLEIRPFSVRENARIQSFPDDWEFLGSMREQYKQIGNAVPVLLAKEIGLEIRKTLDKIYGK